MAITVKHKFVSAIPDAGDTTIVQPSNWNDSHDLVGTVPVANGGTGVATLTGYVKGNGTSNMTASSTIPNTDVTGLGTMSTQNANNVAITGGTMSGVAITGYIPTSEKAQPLGVATLDAGGKVPQSQIPLMGDLNYQGTWNALTNTPTLTSSVGTKGYYYVVDVSGSTNLNGITDWVIGDWAIFNGTIWQKVDNTDAVTSVNGYTGTVNLTYTDVGAFPATSTTGTGNVVLATGATQANPTISNYENFTPTSAPAYSEGRVWYDSTEKALAFYNDSSALAVHVSQDLIFKVINNTGSTIPNGSPVYITGTSSGQTYPNVALAKADVAATSSVIGLTNGAIANGAIGYVSSQGTIDNVNTGTFTVGQVLYLSPYSAGQLMNTLPPTGITVQVGIATFINSSTGKIYVKQTTPLAVPASIITGQVAVANGGTGAATLTGYVKGSGTSAMTASSTIPTTDLSGTVTNAQLANSAITINGTSTSLGGSINVGTVTSVSGTGTVSGIALSGTVTSSGNLTLGGTLDLSSPPTIGNIAPNTGKFTTLESTGTATLASASTTYVTITGDASYPMVKATGGTNTPLVLSPLGTGALQAQKTDSTATGGNARGANAVDWQTVRTGSASQVASGSTSFIGSGRGNTSSGQDNFVGAGYQNLANGGAQAGIVAGANNTAAAPQTFIGGGSSHYLNRDFSSVVGGFLNGGATTSGYFNFFGGGYANSGTATAVVTTNTTTIAVTAGTTLYLSSANANIKVGQMVIGTGVTFPTTYATSTVTTGTPAVMNTSTISGTTLTVGSLASGTIIAGMVITGTNVTAGTYIVSGAGSTWTVSTSQSVASTTITGTAYTFTISQAATTAAGITLSFYTPHGVVVGGGNNQATGAYSFIGGGGDAGDNQYRNRAVGDWSTVAGGRQCVAQSDYSTVIGGFSNSIGTGAGSATIVGGSGCSVSNNSSYGIAGGNTCQANNSQAIALGGRQNIANGNSSAVIGGSRGTNRAIDGMVSFAASFIPLADVSGVQQTSILVLARQTTDATATILCSNNGGAGSTNQVILPNNSAYYFRGSVISTAQFSLATTATAGAAGTATITFAAQTVAPFVVGQTIVVAGVTPTGYNGTFTVTACTTTTVQYANATTGAQTVAGTVTATSLTKAWSVEGAIMRTSGVAGTRLIGTPVINIIAGDTGTTAWSVALAADTTNGGLKVTFTGAALTTIRTVAKLETTEVTY